MPSPLNVVQPSSSPLPFELETEVPLESRCKREDVTGVEVRPGPLRASSYTIYVDLPGNREEMLLVHGYTGTFDRVSRRVATYVRSLEARRAPRPLYGEWTPDHPDIEGKVQAPSEQTIQVLKRRGYLTEKTFAEEEDFFAELSFVLHDRSMRQMPNYIVIPTYDCNLRCSYCFQDHMRTDPKFGHLLRTMQRVVVDRIFEAMPKIEAMHGVEGDGPRHRSIGFFGGEPLLEASRPTVEYVMEKALQLGTASFSAVTNGTELHAYRDLLSPEGISYIQVTLDGPSFEHDQRRIYADGSGSFERIARHIGMALDQGVKVSVRLNIDRNNIGQLPALAREIQALGWNEYPRFSLYVAPIRAENNHTDARTTLDTWELDQALVALLAEHPEVGIIERPDDGLKSQARRIFEDPTASRPSFRESFCSAHTRMYIFDSFGDIYACWDRTGDPSIRIGNVARDGSVTINAPVNALWRSRTVASNPVCRRCRYALHCGGGCAVLAHGKTGKFHSNFCDGFASRFRTNVAEAYVEHLRGDEFKARGERVSDQ